MSIGATCDTVALFAEVDVTGASDPVLPSAGGMSTDQSAGRVIFKQGGDSEATKPLEHYVTQIRPHRPHPPLVLRHGGLHARSYGGRLTRPRHSPQPPFLLSLGPGQALACTHLSSLRGFASAALTATGAPAVCRAARVEAATDAPAMHRCTAVHRRRALVDSSLLSWILRRCTVQLY